MRLVILVLQDKRKMLGVPTTSEKAGENFQRWSAQFSTTKRLFENSPQNTSVMLSLPKQLARIVEE